MDTSTSVELFMVAERAVGQAVSDLRGEFAVQLGELESKFEANITGIKDELNGELNSFRDTVHEAFKENNKSLRAEVSGAKDIIVQELVDQMKV